MKAENISIIMNAEIISTKLVYIFPFLLSSAASLSSSLCTSSFSQIVSTDLLVHHFYYPLPEACLASHYFSRPRVALTSVLCLRATRWEPNHYWFQPVCLPLRCLCHLQLCKGILRSCGCFFCSCTLRLFLDLKANWAFPVLPFFGPPNLVCLAVDFRATACFDFLGYFLLLLIINLKDFILILFIICYHFDYHLLPKSIQMRANIVTKLKMHLTRYRYLQLGKGT